MRLICDRKSLHDTLQIVGKFCASRGNKEVLKHAKLQAEGSTAVLIGTDQEIGIRSEIPVVESEGEGTILLPTNRVSSILREFTDEKVCLETEGNSLTIRTQSSKSCLLAPDPQDFPEPTPTKTPWHCAIPRTSLKEAIRRTSFAPDTTASNPALGGVMVEFGHDTITLASTDRKRLSVTEIYCRSNEKGEIPEEVIVPVKAMFMVERTLVGDDEYVYFYIDKNQVGFQNGNHTVTSRLIDGRFPKYREIIPTNPRSWSILTVGPFLSAIRQAQVTSDDYHSTRLTFTPGSLLIESQDKDIGSSEIVVPADYEGPGLPEEVKVDIKYVSDFLKALRPEDQVTVEFFGERSAVVFKAGQNYTYLVATMTD